MTTGGSLSFLRQFFAGTDPVNKGVKHCIQKKTLDHRRNCQEGPGAEKNGVVRDAKTNGAFSP